MELIIFDTEFTTWEGAQERRWQGADEYKEIIQISAIKVNWPAAQIIDELNLYVKPILNPVLSDYCQELTKIRQEDIEQEGLHFQKALEIFLLFCETNLVLSFGQDACIVAENILFTHADPLTFYGRNSPSFIDIKYWFILADKKASMLSSGKLGQYFSGAQHERFRHEHHALSDCYSILQAMVSLHKSGAALPV